MKKITMSIALMLMLATPAIFLASCGTKNTTTEVNGFYVVSILFAFDEGKHEQILNGELDAAEEAQSLIATGKTSGEKAFFGTGGVYEEMQTTLSSLTGQAALNKFNEYLLEYNQDPGMDNNQQGYLIPLGRSIFVLPFEELARSLFNNEEPEASIGNAFIRFSNYPQNDYLGYCVSEYGVHVIMIKSLATC